MYRLEHLYEKLVKYNTSEYYPLHMPGHKRNPRWQMEAYGIDITEIDGFDNLHQAEGIIREAEALAAQVFGAEESHYLVNGSTCGILSAVSAVYEKGKRLAVARNCHKSVYHALLLNEAEAEYLYPEYDSRYGINGGITPVKVEKLLTERAGDICGILITSPTYDGVVSDVGSIVELAHKQGIPVIVDEAHGAHFAIDKASPESAVVKGADIVIQSLHKTLPSLTQTAILHVQGDIVDRVKLRRYLQIYQTSSPSYVLMASMSRCIDWIAEHGEKEYGIFHERLHRFYEMTAQLQYLRVLRKEDINSYGIFDFDESKVLISTLCAGISGKELSNRLRREYYIELEMAAKDYALGIFTVMDTDEGMMRLADALIRMDRALGEKMTDCHAKEQLRQRQTALERLREYPKCHTVHTIAEALEKGQEVIPWADALERVCGEFIYVYPPGIPLLAPGERISTELYNLLEQLREDDLLTLDTVQVVVSK